MYKFYSELKKLQLTGKSIGIEYKDGLANFINFPRFTFRQEDLQNELINVNLGITVGFKEVNLITDSCDLVTGIEDTHKIYFPELNKDVDHITDLQKGRSHEFPEVLFSRPICQINVKRAPTPNHYYIIKAQITSLDETHDVTGPSSKILNEFCTLFDVVNSTPECMNSQIYINSQNNLNVVVGCSNNILGSSGAGKSRLVSDLLRTSQLKKGKHLEQISYQRFISNIEDTRNVLIVADEPSLDFSLWYASGDYNYVMYGLNQRKLQTMIKYLVTKYIHDLTMSNRMNDKYKLLNIYIDSITEVIYAPTKVGREGEEVANTTFVKGISSSVKPEMLSISRAAGLVPNSNIIITLINTANIPGTGELADETAFWNMISGNSVNSIWVYRHSIKQQRDRTSEERLYAQSANSSLINENNVTENGTCQVSSDTIDSNFSISKVMQRKII